jgi:ATP-binding cassette subfamily F protein uup
VRVGYYDQQGRELPGPARVRDLVAGSTRVPGAPEDLRLMERFWFGGELQWARVATLSGGERRRLQLLVVLAERPNVLLLDEPTNDLDLDTLRALEDFLEDWPGALVAVSHDRAFLTRTTSRLVEVRSPGRLVAVPGGVDGWIRATAAAAAGMGRAARRTAGGGRRERTRSGGRSASTLGYQLREADKDVARLAQRRDHLAAELGRTSDHAGLARIGSELAEVQAELAEAEDRWLALASEAEG